MKVLVTSFLLIVFLFGCATKPLDSCCKSRKNFSKQEELMVWKKARFQSIGFDVCGKGNPF